MKWIRIEEPFPIPIEVKAALKLLWEAGHESYLVGGCVRDFLLKKPIKDFDLATAATPDILEQLFPHSIGVGKAFGVFKVPYGAGAFFEVATFRKDLEYVDFRRPSKVEYSNAEEDAGRRDFTINSLFYDFKTQRVLDFFNGIEDLQAKVIRAVGDPKLRFREDALRILRAVRFSTRFLFKIEEQTFRALLQEKKLLKKISMERVRLEWEGIFSSLYPEEGFEILKKTGILELLLPEALGIDSELLTYLKGAPPGLMWAALLTGVKDQPTQVQSVCDRFKLSKASFSEIRAILLDLGKFQNVFSMRTANLERWVREPHFENLLKIERALVQHRKADWLPLLFCESRYLNAKRDEAEVGPLLKLVSGDDLIELGFQPGPFFSEILRVVEDLALEKKLKTREEALEFIVQTFAT